MLSQNSRSLTVDAGIKIYSLAIRRPQPFAEAMAQSRKAPSSE